MITNVKSEKKHVLITGGGRGIGAAIALNLDPEQTRITLVGRNKKALQLTQDNLREAQNFELDVSQPEDVDHVFTQARERFGKIDILINNAGVAESALFEQTSLELFEKMLQVNLLGTFLCSQAALKTMDETSYGRIINIASTAGLKGYAYVSAYCASKHAVVGLTKALALELAKTNITVNAICPGYTETEMLSRSIENIIEKTGKTEEEAKTVLSSSNPQKRLIQPIEIANTVRWLCEETSSSVTGQSIVVAGGEIM